jgi:hypothetical protein
MAACTKVRNMITAICFSFSCDAGKSEEGRRCESFHVEVLLAVMEIPFSDYSYFLAV